MGALNSTVNTTKPFIDKLKYFFVTFFKKESKLKFYVYNYNYRRFTNKLTGLF